MPASSFKVGSAIIHRIVQLEASSSPILEFFPELTPELLAMNRHWLRNPKALDDQDRVFFSYQSFLIQTEDHNILIDACLGNDKDRPGRPNWHQRKDSNFIRGLASVGLTPADIDYVLCTHLHADHVGWNTRLEDGRWVPTFPNARYLFSDEELRFWLQKNEASVVPAIADSVVPILDARQCDVVASDHSLNDLITLIPTPGHTKGHYSVTLGKGGRDAVFTGDLIHSPLQARWPHLSMRADFDGEQARQTRRKFLETYCDTSTLCCFAHFPAPSKGYIERWEDGFRCRFAHD